MGLLFVLVDMTTRRQYRDNLFGQTKMRRSEGLGSVVLVCVTVRVHICTLYMYTCQLIGMWNGSETMKQAQLEDAKNSLNVAASHVLSVTCRIDHEESFLCAKLNEKQDERVHCDHAMAPKDACGGRVDF